MFFTPRTLIISTLCSAFTLVPQLVSANFTVENGETVGGQELFDIGALGTINEGGTISTTSDGVIINRSAGTVINNGVIMTSGDNRDGISALSNGNEITNTGSITTSGSNSVGINVRSETTITNSGEIRSDSGIAIQVSGSDANITLEEGSEIIGDIRFAGINNTLNTTGNLQLDDNINGADTFNTDAGAGDTQTFNGNITDNTIFNVNGAGSVILNGNNTSTGDTTINDGTLQIGSNERIADSSDLVINGGTFDLDGFNETVGNLSGSGGNIDIGNSGTLTVNQTDDATYAGDFSGFSGNFERALIKNGEGTLILSGTNNQTGTGAVEVRDGILAVSGGNAIADTFGLDINGGTFELLSDEAIGGLQQSTGGQVLLNDNTLTLKGDSDKSYGTEASISGTGDVVIEGDGLHTFRVASTYSGQTIINDGGELQVRDLSALGTSAVTVNSGGLLRLFNDLNISSLSGNGSVNLSSLLSSPTLTTGMDNSSTTFSGVLSGSDVQLIKAGTGNFTLSGTNTYSGATTVDNGVLAVNGSIANSATTINSNGTLGGSGTVGDVALNDGVIAPGNSIGTLNIDGDIDFSGGGVYEVEVNADGSSDKIIATGNALLSGGRVSVLPEPGDYAELTSYSFLEADSLSGEFDSVSVDIPEFAFLEASLDYTATEVSLNLERNETTFSGVANTPNTISTANALTQASSAALLSNITDNLLTLDNQGAQRAFESLSGNQLSQASSLSLFANQRFSGLLNSRSNFLANNPGVTGNFVSAESLQALAQLQNGNLSALSDLPATAAGQDFTGGSGFWLTPQAGFGDIDATSNARGTDFNYGGLAAGYDHWFDNNLLLGASLSYSETRADDVDMDSFQGAIYGRWLLDNNRYLDGTVSLGRHQSDSERLVIIGNNVSQANGDYDIDTRGMALELGQDFTLDNAVSLTPFAGIQYTHLDRESFNESGAGEANLAVDDDRQESLRSLLGIKVAKSFTSTSGKQWDVDASLAWVHEFADNTANTNAAFAAAPAFSFKTAGPKLNRDRAQLGLGVTTALSDNSNIRVGYQGEIASTDQDHSAYATFQFNW